MFPQISNNFQYHGSRVSVGFVNVNYSSRFFGIFRNPVRCVVFDVMHRDGAMLRMLPSLKVESVLMPQLVAGSTK